MASSKHGPDDPRVLVGDRNRGAVVAAPLSELIDPLVVGVCLGWRRAHHGPGAMDEQTAQMLAPALRDAHQSGAIAAGELLGHEANPGGEMTPVLELGAIAVIHPR